MAAGAGGAPNREADGEAAERDTDEGTPNEMLAAAAGTERDDEAPISSSLDPSLSPASMDIRSSSEVT